MREQLERLRGGEIDFDVFAQKTRRDWERMSQQLFARYKLPAGVTRDDIEQEMLIAAWRSVLAWDPEGSSLKSYVVWNAMTEAKRFINVQRNSLRRSSKGPGRYPCPVSSLGDGEMPLEGTVAATQQVELERREVFESLLRVARDERERGVLLAYAEAGGDRNRASKALWGSGELRLRFGLRSEAATRRLVRRVLKGIRERSECERADGVDEKDCGGRSPASELRTRGASDQATLARGRGRLRPPSDARQSREADRRSRLVSLEG